MSKKQEFLEKVTENTNYIPVGFWFHYLENEAEKNYFENEEIFVQNVNGHKNYSQSVHPDFIKLMSDGFFNYPNPAIKTASTIDDLKDIQPLTKNHPWITKQAELVQAQIASLSEDVATFYNIFAPATYLKLQLGTHADEWLATALIDNPSLTTHVLDVIASDIADLSEAVIKDGGATGIYLSVSNIQDNRITPDLYSETIKKSDLIVANRAEEFSKINILHICGYEGKRNNLEVYQDFPFKIINWATHIENVSLADGKQFFVDKIVLGGFDNRNSSIIATGTKEEIQQFTLDLIKANGSDRLIIGADCTLPFGISFERIQWVKEVVTSVFQEQVI